MNTREWLLDEGDIPSHHPDVLSTLFCVGNGQCTTRGTNGEDRHEAYRGVYVSGLYTKAGYGLVYYMGAPDWLSAWIEGVAIDASRRRLDMRDGVLHRRASGRGFAIAEERFASFADARIMAQRFTVEVQSGTLEFVMGLDGEVRNHRAKYYQPGQFPNSDTSGLKLSTIEAISAGAGRLHVALKSRSTEDLVSMTARVVGPPQAAFCCRDGRALACWQLPPGKHVLEKVCALDGEPGPLRYEEALRDHLARIHAFWAVADVQVDGDARAQQAVRFAVWSTRIGAPRDGGSSSMGAKNLTGDWYRGAVFWDMEMYQLPMLAAIAPDLARNHILYRANRLAAAKVLAGQDGYQGARFPWHSYRSGLEEPPMQGGFLYMQQHVNNAVAWGILHYRALTGDTIGTDVLIEVARFWASRVHAGHIHGVCGPDEIHAAVTDNAYTNRMVIWLWQSLADEACVPAAERKHWQALAATLVVPRSRDGRRMLPYAGWEQMPEPNDLLTASDPAADKRCKQADLLMLFHALPLEFDDATVAEHWHAYAPLCDQTSSLSLSTHALIATRLGLARDAERFMRISYEIDLGDIMGNTCDGLHGAGQGGIWLSAVHGCGGLRVGTDRVVIAPALPPWWSALRYRFLYHGQVLHVQVGKEHVTVENEGTRAVTLELDGEPTTVFPRSPLQFACKARWRRQELQGVIFSRRGEADILPGAVELLQGLRAAGVRIALASASRDCQDALDRTGWASYIDAVSDGSNISASKPDPQVFYLAAQRLRLLPWNCVGVEDSAAGIESIHRAGMAALGVGDAARGADMNVASTREITVELLKRLFRDHRSPLDPYLERHLAKVANERGGSYGQSLEHGAK